MAFRDFRSHPGKKFAALLRRSRHGAEAEPAGHMRPGTALAEAEPEAPKREERPAAELHRSGRPIRRIEIERAHGGHIVTVHRHPKKGKKGQPAIFEEPERHVHETLDGAHAHIRQAMEDMEPEPAESRDLAERV